MSMDLIISDTGHVMIASNEEFQDEIVRVDLLTSKKLLMLNYKDGGRDADLLDLEVHDRMMSALMKAPSVLLVHVRHNMPVKGYDVPLMQYDFTPE